jgi:hypothetical protein
MRNTANTHLDPSTVLSIELHRAIEDKRKLDRCGHSVSTAAREAAEQRVEAAKAALAAHFP